MVAIFDTHYLIKKFIIIMFKTTCKCLLGQNQKSKMIVFPTNFNDLYDLFRLILIKITKYIQRQKMPVNS